MKNFVNKFSIITYVLFVSSCSTDSDKTAAKMIKEQTKMEEQQIDFIKFYGDQEVVHFNEKINNNFLQSVNIDSSFKMVLDHRIPLNARFVIFDLIKLHDSDKSFNVIKYYSSDTSYVRYDSGVRERYERFPIALINRTVGLRDLQFSSKQQSYLDSIFQSNPW